MKGGPGVTFVGCGYGGSDTYDAGAIRIDATLSGPMVVSAASVRLGPCSYNPWPGLNVTIGAGNTLILTQTDKLPRCTASTTAESNNFDTSESFLASPQYQTFLKTKTCTNDGYVPEVTVTINGMTMTLKDAGQVLNRRRNDQGICSHTGEYAPWTHIQ